MANSLHGRPDTTHRRSGVTYPHEWLVCQTERMTFAAGRSARKVWPSTLERLKKTGAGSGPVLDQ
jgi:hypothetical protein